MPLTIPEPPQQHAGAFHPGIGTFGDHDDERTMAAVAVVRGVPAVTIGAGGIAGSTGRADN
jgi:hypothetical protein